MFVVHANARIHDLTFQYSIEKKYNLAEDHLLLGTDHSAELIGKLAYNWAADENVQWKGIYLARIVLQ